MERNLHQVQDKYLKKIEEAQTLAELDKIFLALFGRSGKLTLLPKEFPKLNKEELKKIGPLFNLIKTDLEKSINEKREAIREVGYAKLLEETADLSIPVEIKKRAGHLHPLTQFEQKVVKLFSPLGFSQFDAPHIDTDDYNFSLLNIPKDHPARDLWDTFYIVSEKLGIDPGKLLLRTHTSNSQIRIMRNFQIPIRKMNLGRCFRYENLDARHEHTFDQFELVYIDKGLSMANLQYLSEVFFKSFFGADIKARLRPKYYPFVEPGVGVDGLCPFCKGKGCKICGQLGWLELAGAGMIHPTVLKNGRIDPNIYSGIAWGAGPLRMLMLEHNIDDIRLFLSSNLDFLERY